MMAPDPNCEHTFQSINDMQSICVRCDYVLTIGDGKCFRCQVPMDDHFGVASGPAPGTCVTIKRGVQQ